MKYAEFEEIRFSALGIIADETNLIANLANLSSVIYHGLPGVNWVGFYLWDDDDEELVLGPFQGKPACLRIKSGKGVCGQSFKEVRSFRVEDVEQFPGHITCDPASRSELVIPLLRQEKVYGVLDMDAPVTNFFTKEHEGFFTNLVKELSEQIFSKD